jgi:hypothetical protein
VGTEGAAAPSAGSHATASEPPQGTPAPSVPISQPPRTARATDYKSVRRPARRDRLGRGRRRALWWHTEELYRMTIQELINTLEHFDPVQNVFVALFKNDGTSEIFEIEEIGENNGNAQLEIYEEET